ncbi:helix-turn-helix transcriptional regulator [Kordia sp. YSTF-M3]|uniref:Helix-turn-helix transcriptional regulator n=1 Tax=Kordia aestuariivivens TaxID=2759037 RepID=A0ABR7QDF6_9FLAO|nr:AraC family transcriptional regulator [Kordia aestuariivivens]MBC8756594.1 helix-turn-helix transcriptional regulator [Kordia aestuariivivens]
MHKHFFAPQTSDVEASLYADAYLKKAKQRNDSKKIINGYYYKGLIDSDSLKIQYIDSLIQLSAKRTDHYLMENALVIKAGNFYNSRSYKKALNIYLKAQKYAKKSNNKHALFNIEYNIGIIYNLIEDYENGLNTFKESLKNFETLEFEDQWKRLQITSSMIVSYRQLGKYDSITHYTTEGIKQTHKQPKYKYLYNLFVLNEGINLYFKKKYSDAIDSIQKTVPYLKSKKDDSKLTFAYFYLAKTYLATQRTEEAIDYLKKADTIFLKINYLFPETRATYELLIDHYKKKKDLKKQLTYIDRLLRLDSIIHDKEMYLAKHISEGYNTPRLIAAKQEIIHSLQKKENFYVVSIIGAILLILLIGGFLIYQYIQRNVYKKRFEQLLKDQENTKQHTIIDVSDRKKSELNIPEDIVTSVLKNLNDFKQKDEFLSSNVTLQKLAKRFKTNHTYLSKIINVYEDKSFNQFINELRITYAIERLQTDATFRKYTIDAIAEESGFSNTRTFSRAFQRKTNLNPSYFIKNLKASHSV